MADDTTVPWRRSLLFRLFGAAALIALVAVAAATFATARATTVAVRDAQRDSLHADALVYYELVGYAATHRSWTGAQALVDRLADDADRRVTVTDEAGRVLVDSADDEPTAPPGAARARVDPLDIDPVLVSGSLEQPENEPIVEPSTCPRTACARSTIAPNGLIDARVVTREPPPTGTASEQRTTGSGVRAWRRVMRSVDDCLERSGLPPALAVTESFSVIGRRANAERPDAVAACATEARRLWYDGRVAPPALLFVEGESGSADVLWDLSSASRLRIGLLAGGVLVFTLLLCLLLAGSVVRPLRRMAAAAHRAGDGDLTVRVDHHGRDEVGEMARAFNQMADRREQLEHARRRLASDVSHELRTPLSNVRGWLEAAQDGLVEPDGRLLASLHEETLHLQRLVEDLHDLSVGDAGQLRLEPVDIDVADFLEQVADAFRGAAQTAGVELIVDALDAERVRADPVRLRQAVGNVVANALRHTPSGATVTLRGTIGAIEVTDTGAGIPADDLPHVFERFRRVDEARSRATGGSGLGLAIVRQIMEAHGGAASIASTLGEGTTVRLTLP